MWHKYLYIDIHKFISPNWTELDTGLTATEGPKRWNGGVLNRVEDYQQPDCCTNNFLFNSTVPQEYICCPSMLDWLHRCQSSPTLTPLHSSVSTGILAQALAKATDRNQLSALLLQPRRLPNTDSSSHSCTAMAKSNFKTNSCSVLFPHICFFIVLFLSLTAYYP